MQDPVTVFLIAVACLLVAGAAVRPLAARTKVPDAVWLVGFGLVMRLSGMASAQTVGALAPFFAALALIIVLFEAGRDLRFGTGGEVARRARRLTIVGAIVTVPLVAAFSQALSGLNLLPTWSWTHALMLAALMLCTAPEVFTPALRSAGAPEPVVTALEREAALTGALAIAATATCIDLLSTKVGEGKAFAAIMAGFGLGLAFGAFAGLLWIAAVRRLGPTRAVYPYTLAGIVALYVVTDALGGIGALAVLVFGAVVANAGVLVAVLFRPRGEVVEGDASEEDFAAALSDHSRTVEIVRVLLFTFIGLGLGPAGGLLAMGVALGLLLAVCRLLVVRLVIRKAPDRELAALGKAWPRGMVVAGLAALPWAAAVPGTESLTTLVFSAVATSCVAFAVALKHHGSEDRSHETGANEPARAPASAPASGARGMSKQEGPPGHVPWAIDEATAAVAESATPRRSAGGTEIRGPEGAAVAESATPRRSAGGTEIRGPEGAAVEASVPVTPRRTEIRVPEGAAAETSVPATPRRTEIRVPEGAAAEPSVPATPRRSAERTEIRVPTVEEVLAPVISTRSAERTAIRGSGAAMPRGAARVVREEPAEVAGARGAGAPPNAAERAEPGRAETTTGHEMPRAVEPGRAETTTGHEMPRAAAPGRVEEAARGSARVVRDLPGRAEVAEPESGRGSARVVREVPREVDAAPGLRAEPGAEAAAGPTPAMGAAAERVPEQVVGAAGTEREEPPLLEVGGEPVDSGSMGQVHPTLSEWAGILRRPGEEKGQ